METCVIILFHELKAFNDELLHESSAGEFSTDFNEIAKNCLVRGIFLCVLVKNVESKGFFDILTCNDEQSTNSVILNHLNVLWIP